MPLLEGAGPAAPGRSQAAPAGRPRHACRARGRSPAGHAPRPAPGFEPEQIVLARGCFKTPARLSQAEAICRAYPAAQIIEQPHTPHNRIALGEADPLRALARGKRTLVLGEHRSAVRRSAEQGNACPNYWHFSPYGFCPYGCHYCYLAGTPGVRFSPTVKIFLNLPEILAEVERVAARLAAPTAFYLGKLQDGLALDPLTGYSRTLVPFFAEHRHARMTLLTKSAGVENLLDLDHRGHTILSWSLNPAAVIAAFEENTPPLTARIEAMKRCARAGYPVRAVVMPIIPVPGWEETYAAFLAGLLAEVPLQRITLGGICSYRAARRLMERRLGRPSAVSRAFDPAGPSPDGRLRYPAHVRVALYRHLMGVIRRGAPGLGVGLCLEDRSVFGSLGLADAIGRCNCVL
jgi:DNA repair photolyase